MTFFRTLLFEISEQAKFLVPMTLSLTFGLLFGMTSTLVLTPVCYAVLNDLTAISGKLRKWFGKQLVRQIDKQ
jgi:hypothetical protein